MYQCRFKPESAFSNKFVIINAVANDSYIYTIFLGFSNSSIPELYPCKYIYEKLFAL